MNHILIMFLKCILLPLKNIVYLKIFYLQKGLLGSVCLLDSEISPKLVTV